MYQAYVASEHLSFLVDLLVGIVHVQRPGNAQLEVLLDLWYTCTI